MTKKLISAILCLCMVLSMLASADPAVLEEKGETSAQSGEMLEAPAESAEPTEAPAKTEAPAESTEPTEAPAETEAPTGTEPPAEPEIRFIGKLADKDEINFYKEAKLSEEDYKFISRTVLTQPAEDEEDVEDKEKEEAVKAAKEKYEHYIVLTEDETAALPELELGIVETISVKFVTENEDGSKTEREELWYKLAADTFTAKLGEYLFVPASDIVIKEDEGEVVVKDGSREVSYQLTLTEGVYDFYGYFDTEDKGHKTMTIGEGKSCTVTVVEEIVSDGEAWLKIAAEGEVEALDNCVYMLRSALPVKETEEAETQVSVLCVELGKGMTLSAEGDIPADAVLAAKAVDLAAMADEQEYMNAAFPLDETQEGLVREFYAYDIGLEIDGVKVEPAEGETVTVTLSGLPRTAAGVKVLHLVEKPAQLRQEVSPAETVEAPAAAENEAPAVAEEAPAPRKMLKAAPKLAAAPAVEETKEAAPVAKDNYVMESATVIDGKVTLTVSSFSTFFFTVDFYVDENVGYSLMGGRSIMLSALLELLDKDLDMTQITEVSFSDPTLLTVEKQGSDWLLTSLAPFDTEEHLCITLVSGSVVDIFVLDDQSVGTEPGATEPAVALNKVGRLLEDGLYEVSLTAVGRGEGEEDTKYQDVLLVLDTTSSMSGDKLNKLKQALADDGKMLDTLLGDSNSLVKVSIVCFSCWESRTSGYGAQFIGTYTHNELDAAKNFVRNLTVTGNSTNLQLGLMKTSEVLSSFTSTKRPIVIELTDGDPNQYQKVKFADYNDEYVGSVIFKTVANHNNNNNSHSNVVGASHPQTEYVYLKPGTLGFFPGSSFRDYNGSTSDAYGSFTLGSTNTNIVPSRRGADGTFYSRKIDFVCDNHSGATYRSSNGMNPEQALIYCAFDVKSKAEVYTISFGSSVSSSTKALLQRMATDADHAYDSSNTDQLTAQLQDIAIKIRTAASNVVVKDKMSQYVTLEYEAGSPTYTTDESRYLNGEADIYISGFDSTANPYFIYDPTTTMITWKIGVLQLGETREMRYKVRVINDTGEDVPLNEEANITYTDPSTGEPHEEPFPVPTFAIFKYYAVPAEGGSLSLATESIDSKTGTPVGSTATANPGCEFVGWFDNEACTGTPISTNAYYQPQKDEITGDYVNASYYARFELSSSSLTISKSGMQDGQNSIFKVFGEGLPDAGLRIVIPNGGSVTVNGLCIGETYTVTEESGWSYAYTEQSEEVSISAEAEENVLNITNEEDGDPHTWLSGETGRQNVFNKAAASSG